MSRQLTQLIDHLQKLNHQIQIYHEEREVHRLSDSVKVAKERRLVDYNFFNKKPKSADVRQKKIDRRRGFSKAINAIFIFLLVIGTAAALFVVIVLFFHGPKII